jgi:hypothetical protein
MPGVGLVEQDAAGVEADDLYEGLAGAVEEVGGADGALEDAEGARHTFEQDTHLVRLKLGKGA